MWVDILPLLVLLNKYFSNDGGNATDTIENLTGPNNLIQVQNVSEIQSLPLCDFHDKNEFDTLLPECQTLLMSLNLDGLLEFSDSLNNTLSHLAADVFEQKYSNYTVKIDKNDNSQNDSILMDDSTILLLGFNVTTKVLKNFGCVIRKLTIQTRRFDKNVDQDKVETIMGFVNEYCKESLVKLDLEVMNITTLEKLSGPFKKVTDFTCSLDDGIKEVVTTNTLHDMNITFPNITNLTLRVSSDTNPYFVNYLPNLKNLVLIGDVMEWNDSRKETKYNSSKTIIRRNHNIQSLSLIFYPPNFLEYVEVFLDKLENLTLWHFNLKKTHIFTYLTKVKKFELLSSQIGSPTKMSFSNQLNELKTKYNSKYEQEWIDFITTNRNLSRIFIEDDEENEKYFPLERLMLKLSNVEDMTILSNSNIPFGTILKFVATHEIHKLVRFKYGSKRLNDDDGEYFRKELENGWNIIEFHDNFDGFLFERKNLK